MSNRAPWFEDRAPFVSRHIGPEDSEISDMLQALGHASLASLVDAALPAVIRTQRPLELPPAPSEAALLAELRGVMGQNRVLRSYIGLGYHGTVTPGVILRNVLENPGWYTQYTPYQPEISQGRLEALLNFQTMVSDLTGLPVANASLLDEGTAAAEAMGMCLAASKNGARTFFVSDHCHPQTIAVVQTRAKALGLTVRVADAADAPFEDVFGVLLQYPATDGRVVNPRAVIERAHQAGVQVVVATDLLALTLLTPPGELGADIAVGSSQRFGVPLGFGGPHAAFMAATTEHTRRLPGRVVGVTKDARGKMALRLAMQTREQHIRREKATSNICTAQVLLAVMAGMYAVYHGPKGLTAIARRVHGWAKTLATALTQAGFDVGKHAFFDTVRVRAGAQTNGIVMAALERGINLRRHDEGTVVIALDETVGARDVDDVLAAFGAPTNAASLAATVSAELAELGRTSAFLTHPVFNTHHSETEMLRYVHRLEAKDLALNTSMIPLGSCTMKLNATAEMAPLAWPEVAALHPFVPANQAKGYYDLFRQLEGMIAEITGFDAVSLQPNAGSQGEYAGLLAIRERLMAKGQPERVVCLIPSSAHGTNPASAVMAGLQVVVVACDERGNIDLTDLTAKAKAHQHALAALMITYPSTHGVFEEHVRQVCDVVHAHGGMVYMDGANLNALVGLSRPAELGADVCHLNLHKTFAIPHGGGGPGMGPIAVTAELAPHLPSHPLAALEGSLGPVSAAPWGSASILTISYVYMRLMGGAGLRRATEVAILNANYMAKRLGEQFPVVYRGKNGLVAHELIIDLRPFKLSANVTVDDVAKRLMDFGFHAPTMSWPVAGTMMIEPTESESKAELDRFCDAMLAIREEIAAIERGELPKDDNPLRNAPHTADMLLGAEWSHAYAREQGAFPTASTRAAKYWPPVARVDNSYGDRNFVCACPPIESYQ